MSNDLDAKSIATLLRHVAKGLTAEADSLDPPEKTSAPTPSPAPAVGIISGRGVIQPLASGGGQWPGDPAFPGAAALGKDWRDIHGALLGPATADSMWQVTLRSIHYNNAGDPSDCNKIVREKHARGECGAPIFPDARQEWEL